MQIILPLNPGKTIAGMRKDTAAEWDKIPGRILGAGHPRITGKLEYRI
jgi:hypothetical protein